MNEEQPTENISIADADTEQSRQERLEEYAKKVQEVAPELTKLTDPLRFLAFGGMENTIYGETNYFVCTANSFLILESLDHHIERETENNEKKRANDEATKENAPTGVTNTGSESHAVFDFSEKIASPVTNWTWCFSFRAYEKMRKNLEEKISPDFPITTMKIPSEYLRPFGHKILEDGGISRESKKHTWQFITDLWDELDLIPIRLMHSPTLTMLCGNEPSPSIEKSMLLHVKIFTAYQMLRNRTDFAGFDADANANSNVDTRSGDSLTPFHIYRKFAEKVENRLKTEMYRVFESYSKNMDELMDAFESEIIPKMKELEVSDESLSSPSVWCYFEMFGTRDNSENAELVRSCRTVCDRLNDTMVDFQVSYMRCYETAVLSLAICHPEIEEKFMPASILPSDSRHVRSLIRNDQITNGWEDFYTYHPTLEAFGGRDDDDIYENSSGEISNHPQVRLFQAGDPFARLSTPPTATTLDTLRYGAKITVTEESGKMQVRNETKEGEEEERSIRFLSHVTKEQYDKMEDDDLKEWMAIKTTQSRRLFYHKTRWTVSIASDSKESKEQQQHDARSADKNENDDARWKKMNSIVEKLGVILDNNSIAAVNPATRATFLPAVHPSVALNFLCDMHKARNSLVPLSK